MNMRRRIYSARPTVNKRDTMEQPDLLFMHLHNTEPAATPVAPPPANAQS